MIDYIIDRRYIGREIFATKQEVILMIIQVNIPVTGHVSVGSVYNFLYSII